MTNYVDVESVKIIMYVWTNLLTIEVKHEQYVHTSDHLFTVCHPRTTPLRNSIGHGCFSRNKTKCFIPPTSVFLRTKKTFRFLLRVSLNNDCTGSLLDIKIN